jgi:hypothetical protein
MDKDMAFDEFTRRHNEQVESRSQKDVFMIWLVLMFLAVIGAHFLLTLGSASVTGAVVGPGDVSLDSVSTLLAAIGVFTAAAVVGAAGYYGISGKIR